MQKSHRTGKHGYLSFIFMLTDHIYSPYNIPNLLTHPSTVVSWNKNWCKNYTTQWSMNSFHLFSCLPTTSTPHNMVHNHNAPACPLIHQLSSHGKNLKRNVSGTNQSRLTTPGATICSDMDLWDDPWWVCWSPIDEDELDKVDHQSM